MKTREDLIRRALSKVGVLAAGQTPSAEDRAVVNALVVPILSDLSKRNVYPFGDPDQIEDDAFEHLATVLANAVAADFGGREDDTVRFNAERRLRELVAETLSYQPQQAEYF